MKKNCILLLALLCLFPLFSCGTADKKEIKGEEKNAITMKLYIDEEPIPVLWLMNETTRALEKEVEKDDIDITTSLYGGFEQVGPLGKSYPRDDHETDTRNGDIVLYNGNQIVLFFGSNSWAYTRLGKMDLPTNTVNALLNKKSVHLVLTKER